MVAILKRELHSYFTSMIGYLVIAAMLLFVGIYFVFINIRNGYSSFAVSLSSISFLFMVAIPILTMRSFSEDRKNKTDQMLLTSPASVSGIVFGKYLAMVCIMAIICVFCCIFPLILKFLGSAQTLIDYSMILAFFLVGCAAISIGMFISALTESQILAGIGTFGVLLILELMDSLTGLLPTDATGSFFGICLLILIVALIIYYMTMNGIFALGIAVVGIVIATVVYFVKSSLYENLLPNFFNALSLTSRLDNFSDKIFDVPSIIYFITVIGVFLFLTMQSIEKRRWS
jgi:ABC-2 type transport system permease protein